MRYLRAGIRYLSSLRREPPRRTTYRLSIETTNVCNSGCVFCPNTKMKRPRTTLAMGEFCSVVEEYSKNGGGGLDLTTVIGEPLLDPLILDRVRFAKSQPNIRDVGFITTLQHLHRYGADEILDCGIDWITLSVALWGREAYLSFFGVDYYDQVISNIVALLRSATTRSRPVSIFFSLKPTTTSLFEMTSHEDFRKIAELYGPGLIQAAKQLTARVDDWGGQVTLPSHLSKRPLLPRAYAPCRRLYDGLRVYSNGKVGACACRDFEASTELVLGGTEDGLDNLWRGQRLSDLRSAWRKHNRIPMVCRNCRDYRGI